jgi:hypothetical protein
MLKESWLNKVLAFPFWLKQILVTDMRNDAKFLTKVQADWSQNLPAIQEILHEGERIVHARTDAKDEPLFLSPNLPNFRGYYRWVLMPKLFEQAITTGKIKGVTGKWIPLGGVSVFEMTSQFTRVSLYHMQEADETPRDSTFRENGRTENAISPFLNGIEPESPPVEKAEHMHLMLVYGADFAYLRAYYDRNLRSVHRQLTGNIMHTPTISDSFDSEKISDPQIEVKFSANFGSKASSSQT